MDTGSRRFCPRESAPSSAMAARQRCGDSGRRKHGSIGISQRPLPGLDRVLASTAAPRFESSKDGARRHPRDRGRSHFGRRLEPPGRFRHRASGVRGGHERVSQSRGASERSCRVCGSSRRGRAAVILDRRTFRLTDFELQRRFPDSGRQGSLEPAAETRRQLNGFRVDFCRPDLRLVVETDGLRSHHTLGAASLRSPARPGPHRRRPDAAPHNSPAGAVRPSCVREILLATVGGRF